MKQQLANDKSNTAPRRKYTLRFTLTFAFCGLTLLGAVVLSVITSQQVGGFIRGQLRLRLLDTVNIMASQINGDIHSQIRTAADQNSPEFRALHTQLVTMRDRGTEIANVYTMRKLADGQIMFVVDASLKNPSPTGELYDHATKTLLEALNTSTNVENIYSEPTPTADDFGIWLSAYAPIFTSSGQLDGVLGIDISAKNVIQHERDYKTTVYMLSVTVGLLLLPLGLMIARRIRKPLAQLTLEMEKVRQFELDNEINVVSRIREIDSMVKQLDNMKRGLRSFRKYVPADLVRELIELGVDAEVGGKKQVLTIFFSDIANFTSLSEQLTPEALVVFLGDYLNGMNANLLRYQATVDKYIGDGVMAFWGAPRTVNDHAIKACQAALECQHFITKLNHQWQAEGFDLAFYTRIGINTGEVIVGNMGSDARMSYTVIGDNVNLTSRVESANKFYGTAILITENTYQAVKHHFVTRLIDYTVLSGKIIAIRLYELVGYKDTVSAEKLWQLDCYALAFEQYSQRLFAEAIILLEDIIEHGEDKPSQRLLERCQHYLFYPPAADWQGDYQLHGK